MSEGITRLRRMNPATRTLKILILPHPPHLRDPWLKDVAAAVDSRHELNFFDYQAPLPPQFEEVKVVIDQGGSYSTREMADAASAVKLWQILGTGFDRFELGYWRQKKIPVANTPGQFSAVALAESAVMLMLMLARRWNESQANFRQRFFYAPVGRELQGLRLLLVGFGASARELAVRARAFGMKISAVEIRDVLESEREKFGLDTVAKPEDLDRLLGECDYLSLHLHLNATTRNIMDARRLGLLKPSACLINVARGALVDEGALHASLAEGRLAGAGLDVLSAEPADPNHPLFKLPNVITTPHIAGTTDGTSRRRAGCVAANVERIAQGLEPLYRIDLEG